MSVAPGRAPEHTADEWERIKRPFCDLYHKQKKTLPEVRQTLKLEKDFDATERQYKRKIKQWNVGKNTKKTRRHMTHKGQMPPPPDRTRGPSARPSQADEDWSPSTTGETSPEPDEGRSSTKLVELSRQLKQKESQIAKLKLQIQAETASISKVAHKDAAGCQDSPDPETQTGLQQSTQQQQPRTQPSQVHAGADQQAEEPKTRGTHVPGQQATATATATAAPPAPAPEILAVRKANAKKEWRSVAISDSQLQLHQQEPNPFEEAFRAAVKPGRAAAHAAFGFVGFEDFILGLGATWGGDGDSSVPPPATPAGGKAKRTDYLARHFRARYPDLESIAAVGGFLGDKTDDVQWDLLPFSLPSSTPIPTAMAGRMDPTLGDIMTDF